MKKENKSLLGRVLLIVAIVTIFTVDASAADVFDTMSTNVQSWLTGKLGYIIALFAFVGSVVIYAFTHKHSVLFVGFLVAFMAGAGAGIADMSHSMGTAAFTVGS